MEMLAEFKFAPTEQEVMFARCLARESDYAKAWLGAGYEDLGHTKNYTRGITLAKKKKVSERLEFFKSELIQKADIKDYEVIGEIKAVALSNASDFISDEDGELVDFRNLTREQMASVKRIKVTQTEFGVVREVFFHDKMQALEKLAKMLNLYERNNQANAPKIVLNLGKQERINVIDVSEG